MKCNIIGAGRLGKNIALALAKHHLISSLTLCNSTLESTQLASKTLGFGQTVASIAQLPEADIIWISCNDDGISQIVEQLMHLPVLKKGTLVIHSSGVLGSCLLAPLQQRDCFIASFHPLKSFKTNYLDEKSFSEVPCIIEGDTKVCSWLTQAFTYLGAQVSTINPQYKAIYHAAACMASNYLVSLAACSEELLLQTGLSPQQSRSMLIHLMQNTINNLHQTESLKESLTGPLARGDLKTLKLHMAAIKNNHISRLYKAAGLATLPLTHLPNIQQEKIKNMFAE